MGLTPTPPNLNQVARSFWDRREGAAGKVVLAGLGLGAAGAVVFFWGLILPFLIGVAGNTIQLAIMIGILAAITSPLWSKRVRFITSLAFQQAMRWSVGVFVQTDPIGILRENIKQIRTQVAEFDKAVTGISSTRQRLADDIEKQKAGILKNKSLIESVDGQISRFQAQLAKIEDNQAAQDMSLKIEGLKMQRMNYAQIAGFQVNTIRMEQPVLLAANNMYQQMSRIRTLGEFKADALTQQADMEAQRHAMMESAKTALGAGNKMLKGDPQQTVLYEQTLEYLNNDASDTLGAMADFNKWSDKFLTDMDIQNGASAEEAFRMFDQMEKKLKVGPGSGEKDKAGQGQAGQDQAQLQAPRDKFVLPELDLDAPEIQKLLK